jgi:hypothetical protein
MRARHATVVSTPEFAPVSRAVSPCPTPSWMTFATMPATMLIAQIVRMSSLFGAGFPRGEATALVEIADMWLPTMHFRL